MATKPLEWIIGAVLVVFLLQYLGVFDLSTLGIGGAAEPEPDIGVVKGCPDPSNTMTIGPQYVKWATTALTSENVGYWNNGVYRGSQSDGATTTVGAGDKIALLYGLDSSTYYMNYVEFVAPCRPFSSSEFDGDSNELITADTDLTIRAFNGDDGLLNTINTQNESIGSGQEGSWDIEIEGNSEQGISPHGQIWVVVGYEKNNFTASDITLGGKSPSGTIPSWFDTTNLFNYKVFKIDGCPIQQGKKSCDLEVGTLVVKAKDNVNPTMTSTTDYHNYLNITVLTEDYDVHTDNNAIMGGGKPVIEDNDGTRSGWPVDGLTLFIN